MPAFAQITIRRLVDHGTSHAAHGDLAMSEMGQKETSGLAPLMSAIGGKADIASGISKAPNQPIKNLNAGAPPATFDTHHFGPFDVDVRPASTSFRPKLIY